MNDQHLRELLQRIALLERKVSDLYHHVNAAEPSFDQQASLEPDEETIRLLQEGKEIQAIKRHRELTGLGLAEAKEEVERMRGLYPRIG
jgi:ribosomal protein L7/L12